MTEADATKERLSEYERAICYHTIPYVTRPLTVRVIAGYSLVVIAAILLTAHGIRTENAALRTWALAVLGVVVVGGLIGFLVRAFLNQVRERQALAEAEAVPNVESGFDELPDPFANHALLRYYRHAEGDTREITDNRGRLVYSAVRSKRGRHWEVRDPSGSGPMTIDAVGGERSFSFGSGTAGQYTVKREGERIASLHRPFSFASATAEIHCGEDGAECFMFKDGGIYKERELVGRIYSIRNYAYLDIRDTCLNDGTLAFFIAMI